MRPVRSINLTNLQLRDWEQGRVEPDQTARSYLEVIAVSPEVVARALKSATAV